MSGDKLRDELTRRDFHRLATAAFGGVLAGCASLGCSDGDRRGKADGKADRRPRARKLHQRAANLPPLRRRPREGPSPEPPRSLCTPAVV